MQTEDARLMTSDGYLRDNRYPGWQWNRKHYIGGERKVKAQDPWPPVWECQHSTGEGLASHWRTADGLNIDKCITSTVWTDEILDQLETISIEVSQSICGNQQGDVTCQVVRNSSDTRPSSKGRRNQQRKRVAESGPPMDYGSHLDWLSKSDCATARNDTLTWTVAS